MVALKKTQDAELDAKKMLGFSKMDRIRNVHGPPACSVIELLHPNELSQLSRNLFTCFIEHALTFLDTLYMERASCLSVYQYLFHTQKVRRTFRQTNLSYFTREKENRQRTK